MLQVPQHERKDINVINAPPFVPSINSGQALSLVEGLREGFSATHQVPEIQPTEIEYSVGAFTEFCLNVSKPPLRARKFCSH